MFQYDIAQLAVPKRPKVGSKNVEFLLGEEVRPIQPGVRERSRAVIRTLSLVGYPRNGGFLAFVRNAASQRVDGTIS